MRRSKIRVGIAVAMPVLIAVGLLVVNSARPGGATASTLSNSDMGKILGMCGCHHTMYGDCDASGTTCVQCDGACGVFTVAGSQAQTCEFKEPHNTFSCKPTGTQVICKTNYLCSATKVGGFKCSASKWCVSAWFENCLKCTATTTDIKLDNFFCG